MMICRARNKYGFPCKAKANETGYCRFHDPERNLDSPIMDDTIGQRLSPWGKKLRSRWIKAAKRLEYVERTEHVGNGFTTNPVILKARKEEKRAGREYLIYIKRNKKKVIFGPFCYWPKEEEHVEKR